MNAKGLLTTLLAAMLIFTHFLVTGSKTFSTNSINDSLLFSLSSENASLKRFALEENADHLIEKTVQKEILKTKNPEKIKKEISEQLIKFFKKKENENIDFSVINYTQMEKTDEKISSKTIEEKMKVDSKLLNIFVPHVDIYIVEVSFPGDILKELSVGGKIDSGNVSSIFVFPPGYNKKVIAVAPKGPDSD